MLTAIDQSVEISTLKTSACLPIQNRIRRSTSGQTVRLRNAMASASQTSAADRRCWRALPRYVPCAPMLIGQHETSIERTRCQCVCRVPATSNLAAILRCPAETRLRRNWTPGDSLHAYLLRIVEVNSTLLETCDCCRAVAITAAVAEFA